MTKRFDTVDGRENQVSKVLSVGNVLRRKLFNKIAPIITESDCIADSSTRLTIQANCLDIVASVEDLIEEFELDFSFVEEPV